MLKNKILKESFYTILIYQTHKDTKAHFITNIHAVRLDVPSINLSLQLKYLFPISANVISKHLYLEGY